MPVKILSINAHGLNHPAKRASLWKEADSSQCDVLCIQETHFHHNAPPKCTHISFQHYFYSNMSTKKRGVMIAVKDTISFHLISESNDPSGRYLIIICGINNVRYTLMNIYVPNKCQIKFLNGLMWNVKKIQQGSLIMCRDFNIVPNLQMDSTTAPSKMTSSLAHFLRSNELYDAWRCTHDSERDYSFFSHRHGTYMRIDLFLMDKWLLQKVSQAKIDTIAWSDHAPILLTLKDSYPSTTTYVWHANSQIIQNPSTEKMLEDHLSSYFQINSWSTDNAFLLWNAHKAYIRAIFIQLGARIRKQRQQKITNLITEIDTLEALSKNKPTPSISAKLTSLRHDLRLILLQTFEHTEKKTKMSFYSTSNKAEKALARRI